MADTSAALKIAEELVEALKKVNNSSPAEHFDILNRIDKLRTAVEGPYDIFIRYVDNWGTAGALYSLIQTGALAEVPSDGSSITAQELADAINVDISVIQRLMNMVLVNGYFTQTAVDSYAHNGLSQLFHLNIFGGMFVLAMDFNAVFPKLPEYLKTHTPKELYDLKKSPFAYAFGKEGMTYYDIIDEDPEKRQLWNKMIQQMESNMPISGMFPWDSLKEQVEKEPERPFFVDVGGGRGQALLKLQEEIPGTYGGKLILQDLPHVINTLKSEEIPNIEAMSYDIFTPQPVKNAHVYFLRRLLHDFYDEVCIDILRNTVLSMGPDSRLIVCDMIVPDMVEVGGSKEVYWMDLNLMTMSGKEKSLKEFLHIFDTVGLELVKVWPSGMGATSQLETRLKRS
ncbi:S-adenosyl-L-methionine-dependent methyltransferase [Lasiosphaeris hirsuta]|uniref:S-adenosyl-L-methionine-dependent methyltransferase n=1 Tax=Lasiosphaeris hirsuta TaxID=260670 RepID=A0AA40ARN7_9PEZI|nr:S-adenosyl-L-methionine-dependent methyltransferase [Lasiosphaeris hirsuta]